MLQAIGDFYFNEEGGSQFNSVSCSCGMLQKITEVTFDAVVIVKNEICAHMNLTAKEIFKISDEKYVGMNFSNMIYAPEKDAVGNFLSGTGKAKYATKGVAADGTCFDIELKKTDIVLNAELYHLISIHDVSKHIKTIEALRRSEERLDQALDAVRDAVWEWRVDTNEVFFSPRWYTMLGFDAYELEQNFDTWRELVHPKDRNRFEETVTKHVESASPFELEFRMRTKSGGYKWILARGSCLEKDESNGARRILGTHIDITERKHSEQQVITAKEEAEAASKAKSDFLANMSHEIRTPLNGIMGMLQLMQATDLDTEQEEYVLTAMQSSKRLTCLLGDILDITKIEAGKVEIRKEPFKIKDMIDSVHKLFTPSTEQAGLSLHFFMDPTIPEVLMGDGSRLQQVLNNLVGNAIKFTENGAIIVEAHALSQYSPHEMRVLFSVTDTGIGISDDQLEAIIKPFVQADVSEVKQFQGVGLGLSIVKKVVNLMGGNASITSSPGSGTVVHVCVAFGVPDQEMVEEAYARRCFRRVPNTLRVLVVEDEKANRLMLVRVLEKVGCQVITVENGAKALKVLRATEFDLIFMDIQMPVMGGVEATQAIRSGETGFLNQNVPIIALTAYAMAGDRERFLAAGMNDYAAKPLDFELMRGLLAKYCEEEEQNIPNKPEIWMEVV